MRSVIIIHREKKHNEKNNEAIRNVRITLKVFDDNHVKKDEDPLNLFLFSRTANVNKTHVYP